MLFHWIAIEALAGDDNPRTIESKLREAGWDVASHQLGVGKIFGLRSRIVHHRDEKPVDPQELRQAYYECEAMARVLLRAALGIESTWPAPVSAILFDPPWQERIIDAWHGPEQTHFHPPPLRAGTTKVPPDLSWQVIPPSSPPYADIRVDGGDRQDQHRVRGHVDHALAFFEAGREDPPQVRIRRIEDQYDDVVANESGIVFASRLFRSRDLDSEIRLGMRAHIGVASHMLHRAGVPMDDVHGLLLHGCLRGWTRQRVFIGEGKIPEERMEHARLAPDSNPVIVGEHIGALAAGSVTSREIVEEWLEATDSPQEVRDWIEGLARGPEAERDGKEVLAGLAVEYSKAGDGPGGSNS